MGIEFRVGVNDHPHVSDFLAERHGGVSSITIDAKHLKRHATAIEAAKAAGVGVIIETLTDRLAYEGYKTGGLEYAEECRNAGEGLMTLGPRASFVERVIQTQLDSGVATTLVAPHFYAEDEEGLKRNLDLAQLAVSGYGDEYPIRAVCAVSRRLIANPNTVRELAQRYSRTLVSVVELRLSPLGSAHEGAQKVKSVFDILRGFGEFGVPIVLGFQGIIGQTAYALGLVDAFSSGVGDRDSYDYKGAIRTQMTPRPKDKSGGRMQRILLPGAGVQVPTKLAKQLYRETGVRTRLVCRIGSCRDSIDGPMLHPKKHFMHTRTEAITEIDRLPSGWRATHARDELQGQIEICNAINRSLRGVRPLPVRTLESLRTTLDQLAYRRNTA